MGSVCCWANRETSDMSKMVQIKHIGYKASEFSLIAF